MLVLDPLAPVGGRDAVWRNENVWAVGYLFEWLASVPYTDHPANFRAASCAPGKGEQFVSGNGVRCNVPVLFAGGLSDSGGGRRSGCGTLQ